MSNCHKQTEKRLKRTEDFMEAARRLREFRDEIDDILVKLNSAEPFREEVAERCVDIGYKFQGVSKLIRPHTIEGAFKKAYENAKRKKESSFRKWTNKYIVLKDSGIFRKEVPSDKWVEEYRRYYKGEE